MHACEIRIQHLLVWSKDDEVVERGRQLINEYYWDRLYAFTTQEIAHMLVGLQPHEEELEIEKFDFHVLKIHGNQLELILKDNQRHALEADAEVDDAIEDIIKILLEK